MAEFITNESVVTPVKNPLDITTMYNRSVVFEFNGGIAPIACDLEFLYADDETQTQIALIHNYDMENGGPLTSFGDTNGLNTVIFKKKYRFLEVIKYLEFKYGIKHEYYKNKYGVWVDMLAVKPYFANKYNNDIIFSNWITGRIDNDNLETSIYAKLCDDAHFNGSVTDGIMEAIIVKNINKIPAVKYIIKDAGEFNSDGKVAYIGKGDGQYSLEKVKKYTFREINEVRDILSDEIIKFKYELADHNTGTIGSGNYKNNNHHKFDDLLLTFTDSEGNPFTDLDNLLITVNGMIVDYQRNRYSDNKIYINNVTKYADYQIKSLKEGHSLDNYSNFTEDREGNRIINYDVPVEQLGYVWTFDISIYKWDGVSISHFEEPLTNKSILKSEPTEDKKSFWLTTGLVFSSELTKENCILVCGNEIVSKDSWSIDEKDKHVINLQGISAEFDIIYAEMYRRIKLYTAMMIDHTINNAPKITDFLKEHYESIEDVDNAIKLYEKAVEDYVNAGGEYNYHYARSAINVVKQQFIDRQYAVIRFNTSNPVKYSIEVGENHDDLKFNVPYRDRMRNLNWDIDDIVIINGIHHKFVNEYSDVFKPVARWYLPDISNTLDDVNGYKLEVYKRYNSSNRYIKLNYTQLSRGPHPTGEYFTYDSRTDQYMPIGNDEFERTYIRLSDEERSEGRKRDILYYVKDMFTGEYILVPDTINEFDETKVYYRLGFARDYYLKIK